MSKRITLNGEIYVKSSISCFYIGYYDGDFEFKDHEVSEVREISLKDLKKEISLNPEKFTDDFLKTIEFLEPEIKKLT